MQVPLAFKKLVTKIQLIQFVSMNFQAVFGLVACNELQYPNRLIYIYIVYIFSLLLLFLDFAKKVRLIRLFCSC